MTSSVIIVSLFTPSLPACDKPRKHMRVGATKGSVGILDTFICTYSHVRGVC